MLRSRTTLKLFQNWYAEASTSHGHVGIPNKPEITRSPKCHMSRAFTTVCSSFTTVCSIVRALVTIMCVSCSSQATELHTSNLVNQLHNVIDNEPKQEGWKLACALHGVTFVKQAQDKLTAQSRTGSSILYRQGWKIDIFLFR